MEVDMEVLSHEIIGTYVCALTKSPKSNWPSTVSELMSDIATFVNRDFDDGKGKHGRTDPVEALDGDRSTVPSKDDVAVAEFVPYSAGDGEADDDLGTWQVAPFVFFKNVTRGASLDLVQHRSDNVVMRLPETGLLAQAEHEASTLARLGDPEKFKLPPHYYRYFSKGDPMTSVEVLASNIGYYVTASCR